MHKDFYFNIDIVKAGSSKDQDFVVEGYASTPDIDRQGDIIALSALEEAAPKMLENGQTVFFNHDYGRCIGRLEDVSVDSNGMKVKIYVSEWEQELRKKISEKIINKFSIGGRFIQWEKISASEAIKRIPNLKSKPIGPVTIIEKMELFEVSIVGLPANSKAEFRQKSLYQALQEASKEEIENLGQIPDSTSTHILPKPVIKNEGDVIMEEVKTEIVETPKEITEEIVKTEPILEVTKTEEIVEKVEVPVVEATINLEPEVAKAQEIVVTENHEAQIVTTQSENEGKLEVTEQVISKDSSETVYPAGTMAENAVVVTNTVEANVVRTYTYEEVQEMQKDLQKQLEEKETMIQSLKAEVEVAKAQVVPVSNIVKEEPVSEVIEVAKGKSTPLVVVGIEKKEEIVKDPDTQFLGILKGIKSNRRI